MRPGSPPSALQRALWSRDPAGLPAPHRSVLRLARLLYLIAMDMTQGQLTVRAGGLVYTTLLSLVPLLAVSFSVLKGFGVHNQVEPALLSLLEPLGEKGQELTRTIIGFVDNLKVGVLGSVGLAMLLYTTLSLVQQVEAALNHVWHVAQPRPLLQRIRDYLSVILVGPVLVFSGIGATASLMHSQVMQDMVQVEAVGASVGLLARLVPYGLITAAFAFAYLFLPNTRVRPASALVGALVAALLWQTAGWVFASTVANADRYTAIYSGFAIVLLFMVWVYLAWLIVLAGASIAFYHQHPEYLNAPVRDPRLSPRLVERLGLAVMGLVAQGHLEGRPPWTLPAMARHLGLPESVVHHAVHALTEAHLLRATAGDEPGYLPAQDLAAVPLTRVLRAIREAGEAEAPRSDLLAADPRVEAVMAHAEGAAAGALEGQTLRELGAGR